MKYHARDSLFYSVAYLRIVIALFHAVNHVPRLRYVDLEKLSGYVRHIVCAKAYTPKTLGETHTDRPYNVGQLRRRIRKVLHAGGRKEQQSRAETVYPADSGTEANGRNAGQKRDGAAPN